MINLKNSLPLIEVKIQQATLTRDKIAAKICYLYEGKSCITQRTASVNKYNGIINNLTATLQNIKTQMDELELVSIKKVQNDILSEEEKAQKLAIILDQYQIKMAQIEEKIKADCEAHN